MSTTRRSAALRLLAMVGLLSSLGAGLVALGDGGTPTSLSWAAASQWYESVSPDVAALAVARLIALVLVGWLLVATVLQLVAVLGLQAARALADLISPRLLQRLGHGLAGLSLTAGLAAPSAGTPTLPPDPPATAVTTTVAASGDPELPDPASTTPPASSTSTTSTLAEPSVVIMKPATTGAGQPGPPGTAVMRERPPARAVLPPAPPAVPVPVELPPVTAEASPPTTSTAITPGDAGTRPSSPGAPETDTVIVEPGDSLWSIAAEEVAHRGDGGDALVGRYWRAVIEANRERLVDPDNPDLIYPGQELVLP